MTQTQASVIIKQNIDSFSSCYSYYQCICYVYTFWIIYFFCLLFVLPDSLLAQCVWGGCWDAHKLHQPAAPVPAASVWCPGTGVQHKQHTVCKLCLTAPRTFRQKKIKYSQWWVRCGWMYPDICFLFFPVTELCVRSDILYNVNICIFWQSILFFSSEQQCLGLSFEYANLSAHLHLFYSLLCTLLFDLLDQRSHCLQSLCLYRPTCLVFFSYSALVLWWPYVMRS